MSKRPPQAKAGKKRSRKPKDSETPKPQENETQETGAAAGQFEDSNPRKLAFNPETLDRTVIAIPLLHDLKEEKEGRAKPKLHTIIIDLNLQFPGGRKWARQYVQRKIEEVISNLEETTVGEGVRDKMGSSDQYLFARLGGEAIRRLVSDDGQKTDPLKVTVFEEAIAGLVAEGGKPDDLMKKIKDMPTGARAIYHIWPDFPIHRLTDKSISTVKADAARASFSAFGQGIVWAVLDSGIDVKHRHFQLHKNLDTEPPLIHYDFTGEKITDADPFGHGTHVAGIIAGELKLVPDSAPQASNSKSKASKKKSAADAMKDVIKAAVRNRGEHGETTYSEIKLQAISGMAPKCKLVNMRVLDAEGMGEVSSIIAAISKIQEINGQGRRLRIHGVNISVGNDFEPEWFACGQSPLCVEVDRLVKSGVVVVVAAGNSGYGTIKTEFTGTVKMGMSLTINDPGNADLAITVGATHKDMPHTYGVSYFSSKGPTGDGRLKPDLVAPGEKIISCAAGQSRKDVEVGGKKYDYVENSGTSMAAPHVSGVIAAFLSVRREFIGQPEKVKELFLATATDLRRERYFQGNGLVDLMRAIQSV